MAAQPPGRGAGADPLESSRHALPDMPSSTHVRGGGAARTAPSPRTAVQVTSWVTVTVMVPDRSRRPTATAPARPSRTHGTGTGTTGQAAAGPARRRPT